MHRDWSCLQEKPILSPSCYLENHMQGPCLPFFLWAWCRGTIEGFRLFLDPTDLADSQDNCCISLRVLESSSPFASIWMSEWQWWKGGGSYPPPPPNSIPELLEIQLFSANRQDLLFIFWLKRQMKFPFPIHYHCIIYTIHQLNGRVSKEKWKGTLVFRAHAPHKAAGLWSAQPEISTSLPWGPGLTLSSCTLSRIYFY